MEFCSDDRERHGSSIEDIEGIGEGEGSTTCRVHAGRGGAGGRMVSESNEQRSRCHSEEHHDLCQVKEVVEHQYQRKKIDGWEREKGKTELGGSWVGKGRAPEVDQAVQEKDVRRLPAEPQGSRGVESGAIREPPSGHDRGALNRQTWQASKHIIGEGGNAEPHILSPERPRLALRTTSSGSRTHTRHRASSRASLSWTVSYERTGTRQTVFWRYMASLGVGRRQHCEADEGRRFVLGDTRRYGSRLAAW